MNRRKLGRTNLHVSELCLNTEKFGRINDEAAAMALLDTYVAAGGGFIQSVGFCAPAAATPAVGCPAEEIVGRWHQARGLSRDGLVLATRLALTRPAHGGSIAFANVIREACERSLRRLRTGHLDLLVCDWDEHLVPVDDVLEAVDMLIRAGLVRYAVAGGFPPWRVVDSLHRSAARNHARFEALQTEYSLLARSTFETEALAMCREHRLGFLARSPLAGGFLVRRRPSIREIIYLDRGWPNERCGHRPDDVVLAVVAEIAAQRSVSPAQIALAWVLRCPQVSSALVSATSTQDLSDLLRAGGVTLTAAEVGALANVTAGQEHRLELRHA